MKPPTLLEIRTLLDDLNHEIWNQGPPEGGKGGLFDQAHETLRWLLDEYLRPGSFVPREKP